jgi:hypothetical protein
VRYLCRRLIGGNEARNFVSPGFQVCLLRPTTFSLLRSPPPCAFIAAPAALPAGGPFSLLFPLAPALPCRRRCCRRLFCRSVSPLLPRSFRIPPLPHLLVWCPALHPPAARRSWSQFLSFTQPPSVLLHPPYSRPIRCPGPCRLPRISPHFALLPPPPFSAPLLAFSWCL